MREKLAALAHAQWSGWMVYLFNQCLRAPDGAMIIPRRFVERWQRQMNTPYNQLPDIEQESDRFEADKVLAVIQGHP